MRKILLPTGRPCSGKLFRVLLGLNAFAVAAVSAGITEETAFRLFAVFVVICGVLSLPWAGWTMTRYRCNSPSTDDPGSE